MIQNILFGIVTFRERYWECLSFLTLIQSFKSENSIKNITIFIFDNTDIEDWDVVPPTYDDNIKIIYQRDRSNPGISYAYNCITRYATKENFDWIVFFDQDTDLPQEAFKVYNEAVHSEILLKVPLVYIDDKILSPSYYFGYRSFLFKRITQKILKLKNISCINTGLMISPKLYNKVNGYDESLKLDFCDHDFIDRVKKKNHHLEILDIALQQNFSSLTDDKAKALVRYRIFVKDMMNFVKKRNKLIMFFNIDLPRLLVLMLKYKSLDFFKIRFKLK